MIHVGASYSPNSGSYGLTVLFSAPLAVSQNWEQLIRVEDARGHPVPKNWILSRNPRSLHMPDLPVGDYRVTMEPTIQDTQGRMLKLFLQGPVSIP